MRTVGFRGVRDDVGDGPEADAMICDYDELGDALGP